MNHFKAFKVLLIFGLFGREKLILYVRAQRKYQHKIHNLHRAIRYRETTRLKCDRLSILAVISQTIEIRSC